MPHKDPVARAEYRRKYQREYIKRPQVKAKRKHYRDKWCAAHPDKLSAYDTKALPSKAINNSRRRCTKRLAAISVLGNRCSSRECKWQNDDNTLGCTDPRILQIDHIEGGGTKERARIGQERIYDKILAGDIVGYQLLCANCNWIKLYVNREFKHRKYYPEKAANDIAGY